MHAQINVSVYKHPSLALMKSALTANTQGHRNLQQLLCLQSASRNLRFRLAFQNPKVQGKFHFTFYTVKYSRRANDFFKW